jgi:hypothetical protein
MLLKDEEKNVSIELVEVGSHKVVLELANTGYNNSRECKLFWFPDSQRVAFFEKGGHFGATTVYFQSKSGFTESPLPELGSCATAGQKKELKAQGVNKFIEGNTTPKEWLKSGALVLVNDQGWETNDGDFRGCTQTVTIGFDAKHKASILRVTGKKTKDY